MAKPAAKVKGVFERPAGSGRWYARYRKDGVDVRKSFGRNKAAAMAYLDKARTLKRTGEGVVPSTAKRPVLTAAEMTLAQDGVLLGELCEGLLKQIADNPEKYRDQYNPPRRVARIKKAFGKRVASSIRPYEISDWLSSLERPDGKRISPATWNGYKCVFSALYVYGKERDKVSVNPVREFRQRKVADGVIRYLDPEEEARLRAVLQADVDACRPDQSILRQRRLHRICELDVALGIGVRRSEQYRITWDAVNFDRREILVPKTKFGSPRTVLMNDDVVGAMRELQKMSLVPRVWKKGKPCKVPTNSVFAIVQNRTWFHNALSRAKIKNFWWHCLRHTFCSRLVQQGVNLKIVQELAGHRTIAMTARYAHLDKTNLVKALALLNHKKKIKT
jgi:integrase